MDTLLLDLRFTLRSLARRPGFTALATLTLAFGIGATTAIFSFVNGLLLQPLPYPEPDRLVTVWENREAQGGPALEWTGMSTYRDWRRESESFESMALLAGWGPTLTGEGEAEMLVGGAVGMEYFEVLGVPMLHGRGFAPQEGAPGAPSVVVLEHGLWQRRFGGDPAILDRSIRLNGTPYQVVGILPPGMEAPVLTGAEIFTPLIMDPAQDDRGNVGFRVVARLQPDIPLEAAREDMNRVMAEVGRQFPGEYGDVSATVLPLHDFLMGDTRTPLLVLLAAVLCVLLLACLNVAGLLLARGVLRQREMAVRGALGAGQPRLLRQLLTESLVLAGLGGALGLLLGSWAMEGLRWAAPAGIPRLEAVTLDTNLLFFALGLTLVTGLVFGLLPGWALVSSTGAGSARSSGQGGDRLQHRLLRGLVVLEVAVALTLLVGAGLLVKSFYHLSGVDPGFRTEGVALARVSLPRTSYAGGPEILAFQEQLRARLEADPAIRKAGMASYGPLSPFGSDTSFTIEGEPLPEPGQEPVTWYRMADAGFFTSLEVPLPAGRLFQPQDTAGSPPVVVVNESMARHFFPQGEPVDAVGRRIRPGGAGSSAPWHAIIGVVGDIRERGLTERALDEIYLPLTQRPRRSIDVLVQGTGDPSALAPVLRQAVQSLDADLPVAGFTPLEDRLSASKATPRFVLVLLVSMALCALILAAVGIYGVVAFGVRGRTREIGIRIALGADRRRVLEMIMLQGLLLATVGLALGLLAALGLTRGLESLLFEVRPHDPTTFASLAVLLLLVALLAGYLPARRASRVDPQVVLREE